MDEVLILIIVFLALWGGHWMPWAAIPGLTNEDGRLHRLLAYGYGCGVIFVGFMMWAYNQAQPVHSWIATRFLGFDIGVAGLGTVLPRIMRWLYAQHQGCQQQEKHEQTQGQ